MSTKDISDYNSIKNIGLPFKHKTVQGFIQQVKTAPSAEAERSIIAYESASIRSDLGQSHYENLRDDLAKLIFIHLLGYPAHYGQMGCLQLISMQDYTDKRIGYLAMDLFLTDSSELLLLTVNSVKNDIRSTNQYISSLALTFCGNCCCDPLARDVFPEVLRLLSGDNPYLKKKACLTMIKIIKIVPDLIEDMVKTLPPLLSDSNHGVLVSALQLTLVTLQMAPTYIVRFRKLVPRLIKRLRTVIAGNGKSECFIGAVPDPFVQVHMLQLLCLLAYEDEITTDEVIDVVSQMTSKADSNSVAGNAILYECVRTMLTLNVSSAHRVEAASILGKFLQNNDADIRFVSLSLLLQMVEQDDTVVSRHRGAILTCLREEDPSIRRRALEIIIAMVRLNNVEELVHELLQYLVETRDKEERRSLISKITSLVQQFAPSAMWQIDTLLAVLKMSGDECNDEVISTLVEVVSHENDDYACYTVHRLYECLQQDRSQVPLVQSALWFIGEYGDLLLEDYTDSDDIKRIVGKKQTVLKPVHFECIEWIDILELMQSIGDDDTIRDECKMILLTALLKLSDRIEDEEATTHIISLLKQWNDSTNLELHQRANEYIMLLNEDSNSVLNPVLDRMPPFDVDTAKMLRKENELNEDEDEEDEEEDDDDENDENDDDDENEVRSIEDNDAIGDLLGLNEESVSIPQNRDNRKVYEDHGITIQLKLKNGSNRGEVMIKAIITNSNLMDAEDFELQISVPKYIQLQMKPLSCDVIHAFNDGSSTQMFRLKNNNIEEKDTVMRMRILCNIGGEEVDDTILVDDLDE